MNKAYLTLVIACGLGLVSGISWAVPPQWSDYCPKKYLDAQMLPDIKKPGMVATFASVYLIAPMPFWIARTIKANAREKNNYWARRRMAFNSAISDCGNAIDPSACYVVLRGQEDQKNSNLAIERQLARINRQLR